ncbi:MAG: LPS export ABC transporter ATP-binding protein [Planctomycetota bacterium]
MNLLTVSQLVKTYAGRKVVDEVSFSLDQREIVGLLGRNGAGKTTCFRMILGMVRPDQGIVHFDGDDITRLPMYKRARRGIGYLSQEQSIFRQLTVWQNLQAILETMPFNRTQRREKGEELLRRFGLEAVRDQRAHLCSGGEKRKLEIARSLITNPKLILLDEPFAEVDPIAKDDLRREVIRLKNEFGKSVLITDHDAVFTLKTCDRVLVIDNGKVFAEGTPAEIKNDDAVRRTYLGSTFDMDELAEV